MLELSLAQQFAVIRTMPLQALALDGGTLFRALAASLAQMPAVSLVSAVTRTFAAQDVPVSAGEAATIAQALAEAEDESAPVLGRILARASQGVLAN